ncbi:MAG: Glycosyl transferase family 2 [candidate division BRC1 bacterium ADurb.BinA364]|nr:MAG: Glycosyl transferase family 2 [candidate division BRC1 bacterium ADurb.BinA364]
MFSVVIPTRRRGAKLLRALEALDGSREAPPFEAIVVFDGPDPAGAERVAAFARRCGYPLSVLDQPPAGPAAARNRGAAAARGERLLFLGDDILVSPRCLAEHARAATQAPRVGAVGFIGWAPRARPTRFMRFLAPEHGPQFRFAEIADPENCGPEFCYTANFAAPKAAWEAEPFDESFRQAAGEDFEWAYRLETRRGFRIRYAAAAVAWHDHRVSLRQYLGRSRAAGLAAARIVARHPELRANPRVCPPVDFVFSSPTGKSLRERRLQAGILLRHVLGLPVRHAEYEWLIARRYVGGMLEGMETLAPKT